MKGIKTEDKPTQFFLNLTYEDFLIIKQGLGHLQLNYLNLLEEQKDTYNWFIIHHKLEKINLCLKTIKKIENEN